ncbi:mannose-1-phosphate guanylyltransferase [Clostridium sp. SHJSY1]|uniref:mannose-1-phosphate guanylyltransferase n=1 Tax=Clostridium sp. SHJSY1 TaxID=2942483 RepID=UPI002876081C|nr:mannose-1-phosphate guanylyltransferase [Clostridium sp. SHJSY1]MDS0526657.1 mannose-1-phosphate guanylyltransferase [Clostridium sp. SHJSY1]
MLCALIMAGGKGTRFWPLSTEEKPKQFLNLIGEDTMIQMTINRIKPIIPIERIFVCTGEKYVPLVKEQLKELPSKNIIIEPEGRNTAPCITLSALIINKRFKDSNMVVLPSDHIINNEKNLKEIIYTSDEFLKKNNEAIITLGINPTRAETGYGYIRCGNSVEKINNYTILNVDKFVEKPNKEKAEVYLNENSYLWNSGIFMWRTSNIIEKIRKYSSKTYEALSSINNINDKFLQEFINKNYSSTEAISIDYAVLEKSNKIYVIPSNIEWDDIGTWKSIERYRERDCNDNSINGNTEYLQSKSNVVINNKKKVVMIGIENIMVAENNESIFVVNKDYLNRLHSYQDSF